MYLRFIIENIMEMSFEWHEVAQYCPQSKIVFDWNFDPIYIEHKTHTHNEMNDDGRKKKEIGASIKKNGKFKQLTRYDKSYLWNEKSRNKKKLIEWIALESKFQSTNVIFGKYICVLKWSKGKI